MSNGTKTKIKTTVNLDLVLTNVPTPMFVTDENLKVTQISNAALKALGYRRKDVVGKMSCKVLCNTPVCGTNQCTLKRCFSTGENVIADTIAKTSDGKEIPVTAYCSAIFDEDDNIIGGMEVIVDRTADVAAISEINSLIKASEAGQLDQRADVSKATGNYVDLFSGINGMLDAIIAPLNVSAEYIERISQGDIPELITDEYKGDFNEIKNNLNKCIQSLNDLTSEMGTLAGAAVEGKLDTRGDVTKFNGEYATIVKGVNDTLDNVIGPLNVSAEYIERISQGDIPEKITDEYKGDFNEIKNNLNKCIQSLNDLTAEMGMLAGAAVEGKLDTRGDVTKFNGKYATIVNGVNDTLDNVIGPLNVSAEYIERISKGDIPEKITDEYKGDFNEIKNNLNKCIQSLNDLTAEMGTLTGAAAEGKLDTRGDVTKFNGEYATIVKGVNDTLDNVIGPLNVSAEYIERISQGDIPEKITDEYKGDFNEIKNNLNKCIQSLNDLVEESNMLAEAAANNDLETRGDISKFNGDYALIVQGVNDTLDTLNTASKRLKQTLDKVSTSAEQVNAASSQINSGSQALAEGANEQASSLEEISSSLEEMSAMIKQSADNAVEARSLAEESQLSAENGNQVMEKMITSIHQIKASSDQTAKIIKTIDEIAFQTNLLALNAAVEAARAGEAGKGFAVVAEEVRNLAQRSAEAAKNTADMIEEAVKNADGGVRISEEVAKILNEIVNGSEKVNKLINEISAASSEQAQGIEQVNTAVSQLNKVTQQNAANSEESASAAEELTGQAEELMNIVDDFERGDTGNNKQARPKNRKKKPMSFNTKKKNYSRQNFTRKPEEVIPLDTDDLEDF